MAPFPGGKRTQYEVDDLEKIQFSAFPNPFKEQATLRFTSPYGGKVKRDIIDLMGNRVALLFDEETEMGRTYEVILEGVELSKGLYLAKRSPEAGKTTMQRLVLQ